MKSWGMEDQKGPKNLQRLHQRFQNAVLNFQANSFNDNFVYVQEFIKDFDL